MIMNARNAQSAPVGYPVPQWNIARYRYMPGTMITMIKRQQMRG